MRPAHAVMFAACITALAAGCVPTSSIQPVNTLAELGNGEVLIVGKVELDPPLAADEQTLSDSYEDYRNKVLMITDTELRDARKFSYGDLSTRVRATLGDTFFVSHKRQPFHFLQGWVVMRAGVEAVGPLGRADLGNAPLFGVFTIDVRPDDTAVYIGTIRYHRDDFFGTERVEVRDEYAAAERAFREKFGDGVTLRKALARQRQ